MSYRYFAFLDLLGYKELIKADLKSGIPDLRDRLTASFGSLGNVNEADVSIQGISDSIFLTLNTDTLGFEFFVEVVRNLQLEFIKNGLLLRGCISFNQHFQNGKVTYSPALVDAYELETKSAFFPRIVIHQAVIAKLGNENKLEEVINKKLLIKHASIYQVHLINNENWNNLYAQLSSIAKNNMAMIECDPRVYAKHWYLQEYMEKYRPKGSRFRKYLPSWL